MDIQHPIRTMVALAILIVPGGGLGALEVDNVRLRQIEGSSQVEVLYDLSGAMLWGATVTVRFSDDGGASFDITPDPQHLRGDFGASVANGANRRILWAAGEELPAGGTIDLVASVAADPQQDLSEFTIKLPGDVPMDFVHVPAGTFLMGSPEDERGRTENEDMHEVTLTRGFYLGTFETTQGQYEAVAGYNPVETIGSVEVDPNHPVHNLSWRYAVRFTDDMSELFGLEPCYLINAASDSINDCSGFRLPTEAEWERAARAGTQTRYSHGDVLECTDDFGYCDLHEPFMWWDGNHVSGSPTRVGTRLPNGYGLFDMHGNVNEWVADWRAWRLGYEPAVDPTGPPDGDLKVFRGGYFGWKARDCRSAARLHGQWPYGVDPWIGFRVAIFDGIVEVQEFADSGISPVLRFNFADSRPLSAAFSWDTVAPVAGQLVRFTDRSLGLPSSWAWDFGDGTTSSDRHPVHRFKSPGNHPVGLTVTNGSGSSTVARVVGVSDLADEDPRASFMPEDFEVRPGERVRFFNDSHGATDYLWQFGFGEYSTAVMPTWSFDSYGSNVTLEACHDGLCDDTMVRIWVSRVAPEVQGQILVDGEVPAHGGKIVLTPQRGSWSSRQSHRRTALFEAADGRWTLVGVPFGPYSFSVWSEVAECCGCEPDPPWRHADLGSGVVMIDSDDPVIEFDAACRVLRPLEEAPAEVRQCLKIPSEMLPGLPTDALAGLLAHDIEMIERAIECGPACSCMGWMAASDLTMNLMRLPYAEPPGNHVFDATNACLASLFQGGMPCDVETLKTLSSGEIPALGNAVAFVRAQPRVGSSPPAIEVASPFGERAEVSDGVTASTFFDPVFLVENETNAGAAVFDPSGVEELVVSNPTDAGIDLDVFVGWFRSGHLFSQEFRVQLPPGARARGVLNDVVNDGFLEIEQGGLLVGATAHAAMTRQLADVRFPGAAHLDGVGDSTWRSDLILGNPHPTPVDVVATFHISGFEEPVAAFAERLQPGGSALFEDFVSTRFGFDSAKGMVRVVATKPVLATQRTYSEEPTGGTQGQVITPAEATTEEDATTSFIGVEDNASVHGDVGDAQFRTNVGLVNLSALPNRAIIRLHPPHQPWESVYAFDLDPYEQVQHPVGVLFNDYDFDSPGGARLAVTFRRAEGAAYVSKVDNSSDDALTVMPQTANRFWIPSVARVAGTGGAEWHTDLRIHATDSEQPVVLNMALHPQGRTAQVTLPPGGETHSIPDLFDVFGLTGGVGMLRVEASQDVHVSCRVFAAGDDGTRGQGIPMVVPERSDQTIRAGEIGHLIGLRSNQAYRTNIAFQNYGEESEIELRIFSEGGELIRTWSTVLPPKQFLQRPLDVLVSGEVEIARAEVECISGGPVGAYASLVDNVTDDGSFMTLLRFPGRDLNTPDLAFAPALTVTPVSPSEITVGWVPMAGADSVTVLRDGVAAYTGEATSFTDQGLRAMTEYCYTAFGSNGVGDGPVSDPVCSQPLLPPPPVTSPVLDLEVLSQVQVIMSWTPIDGASDYRIFRDGALVSEGPGTTYREDALSSGTQYCYSAQGFSDAGDGPMSAPTCVTTTAAVPNLEVSLPGGHSATFVHIPGGNFQMGTAATERGHRWDEEVHEVTLTRGFFMGSHEVTQGQWQAVFGNNPSRFGDCGPQCPVESVSWFEAAAFANALSAAEGLPECYDLEGCTGTIGEGMWCQSPGEYIGPSCRGYRLPTEAEWERATRAGTQTRFSHGDALECDDVSGYCSLHDEYMWWGGNNTPDSTKPVGLKSPNPWGLYDLHGNVYEWTADRCESSLGSDPVIDPHYPMVEDAYRMMVRGGSRVSTAQESRSAARRCRHRSETISWTGFRLVRTE
jgi:formylglycine-generating enzyme required for sulfatase activity